MECIDGHTQRPHTWRLVVVSGKSGMTPTHTKPRFGNRGGELPPRGPESPMKETGNHHLTHPRVTAGALHWRTHTSNLRTGLRYGGGSLLGVWVAIFL